MIMAFIREHALILGGGSITATAIYLLLHFIPEEKIFATGSKAGIALDKVLLLKYAWLEKPIENVYVGGIIPLLLGVSAGLVKNSDKLRAQLKQYLFDIAEKL